MACKPIDSETKRKFDEMFLMEVQGAVHSQPDCPFNYCDQEPPFSACQNKCRHKPQDTQEGEG